MDALDLLDAESVGATDPASNDESIAESMAARSLLGWIAGIAVALAGFWFVAVHLGMDGAAWQGPRFGGRMPTSQGGW